MMKRWTLSVTRMWDVLLYNGKKAWILASIMTVLALTTWTPTAKADSIAPSVSKTLELTQAQLTDLLSQCDGMWRDWIIHPESIDWKIGWVAEKQCKTKLEIVKGKEILAHLDQNIAQNRSEIAQNRSEIAQMDKLASYGMS